MKKAIIIISVISLVIACLAVLIAVVSLTVLWKPICMKLYSIPEVIARGPVLPIGSIISILGGLLVALGLLISSGFKKTIVIEVLAILILCIVLPVVTGFSGIIQNSWVGNRLGSLYLATQSVTANILSLPLYLVNLASSLCLVTCGMRIAEAVNDKKKNHV